MSRSTSPFPTPARTASPARWALLPIAVLLLGAAALVWSHREQRHLERGLEQVLRSHVEAVVRLAGEATRQATLSTDALAFMQEQQLEEASTLLDSLDNPEARARLGLASGVMASARATSSGAYELLFRAPDAPAEEELLALLGEGLEAEVLEQRLLAELGLSCALREEPDRRLDCVDGAELRRLQREAGLGALLRAAPGGQVRYVAIQDPGGLLALSPAAGKLSGWGEDAPLEKARVGEILYRRIERPGETLFEGLSPFVLPDGSSAVLRVAVDEAPTRAMLAGAARRQQLLSWSLAALFGLSLLGAWAVRRHQLRLAVLQHALAEQEHQQRHWQAVGQLAAEVAHEVRNPLSTVKMVAQRLGRELTVEAEYGELIGLLQSESGRVESVIGDFLDLSRPLKLERRRVMLGTVLEEILTPLRLRAEAESKRLLLEVAADGEIAVDPKRLFQVVANLVGNALDALPAGGTVKVSASVARDGARLTIADDGQGMDAESLARAGEPYATTKPKGTGLGLALTRRFVETHGGTLELSSTLGHGTEARVWLPRIPEAAEAPAAGEAEE